MSQNEKPRVFIGSSTEGKRVAEYLQAALKDTCRSKVWDQDVIKLGQGTIEGLLKALKDFDFAVLVLTADDLRKKRDKKGNVPRDNVILEAGIFLGHLGRERTFLVYCAEGKPQLPTDLDGITYADFDGNKDGRDLRAEINPVALKIKDAINDVQSQSVPRDHTVYMGDLVGRMVATCKGITEADLAGLYRLGLLTDRQYKELGEKLQSCT